MNTNTKNIEKKAVALAEELTVACEHVLNILIEASNLDDTVDDRTVWDSFEEALTREHRLMVIRTAIRMLKDDTDDLEYAVIRKEVDDEEPHFIFNFDALDEDIII